MKITYNIKFYKGHIGLRRFFNRTLLNKFKFTFFIILVIVPAFTLGSTLSKKDSVSFKSPKGALLRSAIIPGWGQLYVNKPVKSVLFISAEAFVIYKAVYYNKIYGYVKETKDALGIEVWGELDEKGKREKVKDTTGYDLKINTWRTREKRNKYCWWGFGIYLMGMLDACVDAHLMDFSNKNIEFDSFLNQQGVTIVLSISIR